MRVPQRKNIGRIIRPLREATGPLVPIEKLVGYSVADWVRVLDAGVPLYGDIANILVDAPIFEMAQRRIEAELGAAR
jgi:hypothetical protein